jgi:hypothetical protein
MKVQKSVTFIGDCEIECDGIHYIEENAIREALGIVDEYVNVLGVIRLLKKERDELKSRWDSDGSKTDA